jgi:hypothetical protein
MSVLYTACLNANACSAMADFSSVSPPPLCSNFARHALLVWAEPRMSLQCSHYIRPSLCLSSSVWELGSGMG